MADYLTQEEDGTSRFILEEGGGFILLEDDVQARVSQVPVEAVVLPDDALARVSQEAVEAVVLPDDAAARVSQVVVEVIVRNPHEHVFVTIID